jgi:hypothetical protein
MMWDNVVNLSHIFCQHLQLCKLYNKVKKISPHTINALNIFQVQILLVMIREKKLVAKK